MLTRLAIDNYALIDHLEIDFFKGFTAITGETGAGKSILVDALDLVLGKRADNQYLLDPGRKCVVEAAFSIKEYNFNQFFEDNSLDYEPVAILRREISPNGKSRAFINDTPVNLSQLKMLGDMLVDIHAQHATSSLHDPLFQLSVVDSFAGVNNELEAYHTCFLSLRQARETIAGLIRREQDARATLDYKQFLLDELKAADFLQDEQESLEAKLTILTHAEEIKSSLFQVQALMNDSEHSSLSLLSQAEQGLHRVAAYHPGIVPQLDRLKSDLIDLNDILMELTKINDSIEFSAEQLEESRQRLDLLYRLQQKHQARTVAELLETGEKLASELTAYSSLETRISDLENKINDLDKELVEAAGVLTVKRKEVFPVLEKEIVQSLKHMGIPEAQFEIRHQPSTEPKPEGFDQIGFYFSANEGHSLKSLSDVASGGELSRVMLAVKSIISDKQLLPTILFDEIDNGLSGDIAGRVGEVLVSAASRMQVIAVTHLPQIAGKAQHHYSVFKQSKNNVTFSNIKFLQPDERIAELAKMIGGREITAASTAAAKELLTGNHGKSELLFND
jgi:DNA repair protein RecN (Recombination protein N)